MQISITNPQLQTYIFILIFSALLLLSIRKYKDSAFFSKSKTAELKGFAILTIIFSHIGYFLATDNQFLYPFSILAGVGVNLFLFLSGFGLTISSIKHPQNIISFYYNRLKKLFIPMWIVIICLFTLDYLLLGKSYTNHTKIESFLGFFPVANLFYNLNSPLWYFTMILFYYLIFPIVFWKKIRYLSPILILILSYYLLNQKLPDELDLGVLNLYKLHFISFPLGVLFALLINEKGFIAFKVGFKKTFLENDLKDILILIFAVLFAILSVKSGVGLGKNIEQTVSLITMFLMIFIFVSKSFEFKLLNIFGIYSYEIYLIHWPILFRYDFLYKYLPASIATLLYLGVFLGLGYLMQLILKRLRLI